MRSYARLSTDKQAKKELSIPAQLQAMRQYASDRGWTNLEEFVEAGASARTVERLIIRQLLNHCRNTKTTMTDVVLVHKIDRLARNHLADHVAIRAQLRECHVLPSAQVRLTAIATNGTLSIWAPGASFCSLDWFQRTNENQH